MDMSAYARTTESITTLTKKKGKVAGGRTFKEFHYIAAHVVGAAK